MTKGGLRFIAEDGGFLILFIVVMHLLSMFSIFYCIYFCTKTLKSIELGRNITFGDYAGEFFLIWFFVIGIWIIQPKINNLAKDEDDTDAEILDRF
ncbi:MAG: hypothetical protein ACI8ZM_000605 [Crocinitomix sp.]|jgi:hypothetical protein